MPFIILKHSYVYKTCVFGMNDFAYFLLIACNVNTLLVNNKDTWFCAGI